jgi:hypothetical protein
MSRRPDVHASLADVDRKLRELQHELELVTQGPDGSPAAARPEPPATPPTPPVATPPPPRSARALEEDARARAEADAIVARARAEAARIVDEAAAQVAAIGAQIDEFQRLRDELQRSARALVEEYERSRGPVAAPSPPPPPPPTPSAPPPAPAANTGAPSPAASSSADDRQFEGEVVINAGPFVDIATLGVVERALARLARTEEVYVRGFEGNRALIDVKLAGPVPLLGELRRELPFGFELVEIGYERITLDLDAPEGG